MQVSHRVIRDLPQPVVAHQAGSPSRVALFHGANCATVQASHGIISRGGPIRALLGVEGSCRPGLLGVDYAIVEDPLRIRPSASTKLTIRPQVLMDVDSPGPIMFTE